MTPSRKLSRRSFVASVVGGIVTGGGAAAVAQTGKRCPLNDGDSGANSDAAGRPVTDNDAGATADPACRRPRTPRISERRCSDSDRGRNADPAHAGRRCGR